MESLWRSCKKMRGTLMWM